MAKRGQGEGTISKLENGTYCGRITVGKTPEGKQKRKAFYGKTKREVQEKMNAAKADLDKGNYIDPSKVTVSEWMDTWLYEYKANTVKASTVANHKSVINAHIIPKLGKYMLKDLKNETVQRFINDLSREGLGKCQIEKLYGTLKMALEQAVINEMILKNPAVNISTPKYERKEARVLTHEEQEKFIRVAPQYKDGEIYILMLYTGLRVGEAAALQWGDIDFENKLLSVKRSQTGYAKLPDGRTITKMGLTTPKTKTSIRNIPLIPKMLKLLTMLKLKHDTQKELMGDLYNPDNFIFCTSNGTMHNTSDLQRKLRRIGENLGIEGVHPHTLRHTFATRGAELGIDLKVMQMLLGHTKISMTAEVYTHVSEELKAINMSKLDNM